MSTLGYASFRRRVPTSSARRLPTRILPKEALAMPKSPLIRLRRQTGRSLSASILPKKRPKLRWRWKRNRKWKTKTKIWGSIRSASPNAASKTFSEESLPEPTHQSLTSDTDVRLRASSLPLMASSPNPPPTVISFPRPNSITHFRTKLLHTSNTISTTTITTNNSNSILASLPLRHKHPYSTVSFSNITIVWKTFCQDNWPRIRRRPPILPASFPPIKLLPGSSAQTPPRRPQRRRPTPAPKTPPH